MACREWTSGPLKKMRLKAAEARSVAVLGHSKRERMKAL